jgi:hypothetical protein
MTLQLVGAGEKSADLEIEGIGDARQATGAHAKPPALVSLDVLDAGSDQRGEFSQIDSPGDPTEPDVSPDELVDLVRSVQHAALHTENRLETNNPNAVNGRRISL